MKNMCFVFVFALLLSGCGPKLATIPARQADVEKITLGSVQSRVKKGAASSVVVDALGSPNIVTSNDDGTETWVYDLIFSEEEVDASAFGGGIYIPGISAGAGGVSGSKVKTSRSKSFIVQVKFDKNNRVADVKYRQTAY